MRLDTVVIDQLEFKDDWKNPSDSELMNSAPQARRKETSMTTISFVHGVCSADFDLNGINQMVCAIQMEMGSTPG